MPMVTTVLENSDPAVVGSATSARRAAFCLGAITFVSMLPVTMLVAPLKELIAVRYHVGPFWTHSFMSVNMIGAVLAAPFMGAVADRRGVRKRVAMTALALDALCLAAMSFAPTFRAILALRLLEGAAHVLALSTLMAIAAGLAPAKRRGQMMGIIGACLMLGTACGTRLGGRVWLMAGEWSFAVAGAVSGLATLAVLVFVAEPRSAVESRAGRRQAFQLIRRHPRLVVPFAYALIDRLCVGVVITTFVLFLANVHALNPDDRGKLLGLYFLLPFALLVYPAGRLVDRIGRAWPIAMGSIAFGFFFASYGYLPPAWLPPVMLASGVASAIMFAPNLALCADLAPDEERGAAYAGFNAAGSLGFVLGPLLAGATYALCAAHWPPATAYRLTFLATGMTEVLCAAITLPMLLKLKRQGVIR